MCRIKEAAILVRGDASKPGMDNARQMFLTYSDELGYELSVLIHGLLVNCLMGNM